VRPAQNRVIVAGLRYCVVNHVPRGRDNLELARLVGCLNVLRVNVEGVENDAGVAVHGAVEHETGLLQKVLVLRQELPLVALAKLFDWYRGSRRRASH
jgi:hypothetical protein